jgi:hypothetical protein
MKGFLAVLLVAVAGFAGAWQFKSLMLPGETGGINDGTLSESLY